MSVEVESEDESVIDIKRNDVVESANAKLAVINEVDSDVDERGDTEELKVAKSLIPWPWDDDKARYFGYRAISFTAKEAMRLIGSGLSCLSNWRKDPRFVEVEEYIFTHRREIADEFIEAEFKRNYGLTMLKDKQILEKSLNGGLESKAENDYLLKLRAYYTPQQWQIMKSIVTGKPIDDESSSFNFTQGVLELARTTERLRIGVRDG